MAFLVVVAHPDDEVLGAGATIYKLAQKGYSVNVCILSVNAEARRNRPSDAELRSNIYSCIDLLGVQRVISGEFPNIKFNMEPHLKIVQFIERAIEETKADYVITHHPSDLNNDHLHTSLACQAAVRLFQRRPDVPPLRELLYMEVPSSTEWALDSARNGFQPDTFVEVGKEAIEMKIKALSQYTGVMRPYPHPRSEEGLMGLAAWRGSQSGCIYAEAFQTAFRRIDNL